jgi:photosystem II stability/assembly factor-like uncharacterized protein
MRFILLGLVLSLVPIRATSQQLHWEPTDGPWYGIPGGIAGDSSFLLCGFSDAEMFRSTDVGEHWQATDTVLSGFEGWIYCLERYNGVWYSNVGRSTDSGQKWDWAARGNQFAFAGGEIYRAIGDESRGTNGLWRSSDNGLHWIECDTGLPSNYIYSIAAYDSTILAGVDSSLCLSTNRGLTWRVLRYFPNKVLRVTLTNHVALAYIEKCFTVRSTDYGSTWPFIDSNSAFRSVDCINATDDTLFVGTTYEGILRSYDKGETWQHINNGIATGPVMALKRDGHAMWAAGGDGLYYSTNDGATWQERNRGFRRTNTFQLCEQRGTVLASTPRVFRSSDHGITWQHTIGDSLWLGASLCANDSFCFAGSAKGLFRSSDGGLAWKKLSDGYVNAIASRNDAVYYQTAAGLYRSIDNGLTSTLVSTSNGQHFSALASTRSSLYAVSEPSILRSNDGGQTWALTSATCYAITGSRSYLETHGDTILASGGAYSLDDGLAWNKFDFYGSGCYTFQRGVLYAGMSGAIATSTDWGATWQYPNNDSFFYFSIYEVPTIQQILRTDDYIYAGTDQGVWRARLSPLVVGYTANATLSIHNSPNPFTNSTSIDVTLQNAVFISLCVFDMTGREVRRIASGMMEAGEHDIPFERGDLPAGVYFYRLTAGNETQTGSMVIE